MWYIYPNIIRTTSLIRPYSVSSEVMVAVGLSGSGDTDSEKVAYKSNMSSKWIIVPTTQAYPWDCAITFNSDTLQPNVTPIHGYPAWVGATYCMYRRYSRWVVRIKANLALLTTPLSTETWWEYTGYFDPHSVTFTKRGAATADKSSSITAWPRWESTTQFGEYAAAGGASGTVTIGLPQWKSFGVDYPRSIVKVDGYYTYGTLVYDTTHSKYIIGTYGSASGWWEGGAPSLETTWTFAFTVPVDSEVEEDDILLYWDAYVMGDSEGTLNALGTALIDRPTYIGEAAIWRV